MIPIFDDAVFDGPIVFDTGAPSSAKVKHGAYDFIRRVDDSTIIEFVEEFVKGH